MTYILIYLEHQDDIKGIIFFPSETPHGTSDLTFILYEDKTRTKRKEMTSSFPNMEMI